MAGLTNLKLLTDFFNKIDHERTSAAEFAGMHIAKLTAPACAFSRRVSAAPIL